ncbi:phage tail sheath subtilisin-like domain-containing protein [Candidatus Pacearchaeota archaeon]|nr:phage tail sheath subtilisin-like domain-containing protein [Candidatus Pacearchaeota archaeon]
MISFNNIPDTVRTPGVFAEVDNSRALTGLVPNPHKVLMIGEKTSVGNAALNTIYSITRASLADGYFGHGSLLTRMCEKFKKGNEFTELHAIAISSGTVQASARIAFSLALSHAGGAASAGNQTLNLLINGRQVYRNITSGWSAIDIASDAMTYISEQVNFPCTASVVAASGVLVLSALTSGAWGNYLDARVNYYDGQSNPTFFADSVLISNFEGGVGGGDLDDVWAVINNEQYQYVIQPYVDATSLTSIEGELADRFKPLEDKQGHGFTVARGALASATTIGNSRNAPHNTILDMYNAPQDPAEWAAALGAQASFNLNDDPARPLHYLELVDILPPPKEDEFTTAERQILLYDGIATFIVSSDGKVLIERCITTYQTNAAGVPDPSYLDIQTLATINEIRYQYKARMTTRFIVPRFKLADDTFPVQGGEKIAQPKTIAQEIIALFTELQTAGLIENIDEFITSLRVERNSADKTRVDVLLPPDLINQFRVLAGLIQFIL